MNVQNKTKDEINYKKELNRARKEMSVLYEVSNAMRSSLELNKVLHIILTGVTSHSGLGFNRAILFLVNKTDQLLEPKMAIGPESGEHAKRIWEYISQKKQDLDDLIQYENIEQDIHYSALYKSIINLKIPIKSGKNNLLAKAYNTGKPMHITPDEITLYKEDVFFQAFATNELIIMPLKAKNKVNGVIIADNLYTQKSITEQDLKIFMMLSNQAGLAIENSQLYELVKLRSHTDPVTNLWNHGFFQNQLSDEIDRHKKDNQILSLIMVDIDNFKGLNDSLGHQNGDIILKEIAHILKNSSREDDFVCRYGGDEFSIILPQTTKDHCSAIAERIRQRIEEFKFSEIFPEHNLGTTASIGLASFPENAVTQEEFIEAADRAMYHAKFQGKNQINVA